MPLTLVLVIALTQGSLAPDSGEVHLRNLRQLTFGGQNAEAYFSASGRLLIFQRQGPDEQCDQMYMMGTDGGGLHRVSSGRGRTTCGYFFDQDRRSEEHTSELQSRSDLVCRLLLEKKKKKKQKRYSEISLTT